MFEYDWSCEGPGLGNCSNIPSFVPSVADEDYKLIRNTFLSRRQYMISNKVQGLHTEAHRLVCFLRLLLSQVGNTNPGYRSWTLALYQAY